MEEQKNQARYEEFSKEQQKAVQADVDAVLAKHSAEIVIAPVITPQGTIGAVAQVFRKVLPETGIPSQFVASPETANGAESAPAASAEPAPKAD